MASQDGQPGQPSSSAVQGQQQSADQDVATGSDGIPSSMVAELVTLSEEARLLDAEVDQELEAANTAVADAGEDAVVEIKKAIVMMYQKLKAFMSIETRRDGVIKQVAEDQNQSAKKIKQMADAQGNPSITLAAVAEIMLDVAEAERVLS